MVDVLQGSGFRRAYKRLHPNQKADVDDAVAAIVADPTLGEGKKSDLGRRVRLQVPMRRKTLSACLRIRPYYPIVAAGRHPREFLSGTEALM